MARKNQADKLIEKDLEINSLAQENRELRAALEAIVNRYVANRGTDSEFICCITPKHASEMTPLERQKDDTWQVFDRARILLGEK